jgi:hypothetical protein
VSRASPPPPFPVPRPDSAPPCSFKPIAVKIVTKKGSGRTLGYGFVGFGTRDDMREACHQLNGIHVQEADGRQTKRIKVTVAKPRTEVRYNTNVYMSGLPANATEGWLDELCAPFGEILELKILTGAAEKGHYPTLSGFVRFARRAESDLAISKLHGGIVPGPKPRAGETGIPRVTTWVLAARYATDSRTRQKEAAGTWVTQSEVDTGRDSDRPDEKSTGGYNYGPGYSASSSSVGPRPSYDRQADVRGGVREESSNESVATRPLEEGGSADAKAAGNEGVEGRERRRVSPENSWGPTSGTEQSLLPAPAGAVASFPPVFASRPAPPRAGPAPHVQAALDDTRPRVLGYAARTAPDTASPVSYGAAEEGGSGDARTYRGQEGQGEEGGKGGPPPGYRASEGYGRGGHNYLRGGPQQRRGGGRYDGPHQGGYDGPGYDPRMGPSDWQAWYGGGPPGGYGGGYGGPGYGDPRGRGGGGYDSRGPRGYHEGYGPPQGHYGQWQHGGYGDPPHHDYYGRGGGPPPGYDRQGGYGPLPLPPAYDNGTPSQHSAPPTSLNTVSAPSAFGLGLSSGSGGGWSSSYNHQYVPSPLAYTPPVPGLLSRGSSSETAAYADSQAGGNGRAAAAAYTSKSWEARGEEGGAATFDLTQGMGMLNMSGMSGEASASFAGYGGSGVVRAGELPSAAGPTPARYGTRVDSGQSTEGDEGRDGEF